MLSPKTQTLIFFVTAFIKLWTVDAAICGDSVSMDVVRTHFEKHCFDCHGNGAEEGGFQFEALVSGGYGAGTQGKWEAVWKNIRAQTMPPADAELPSSEQRLGWVHWIQESVFRLNPQQIDPGHSVIRRLNRSEYQVTIKELTDIDYRVEEEFPADDTGYGFDTVGESLTLSPVLLEKYLAAASSVIEQALPQQGPSAPERTLWSDQWKFGSETGGAYRSLSFEEAGELHLVCNLNVANRYRFQIDWQLENGWAYTEQEGTAKLEWLKPDSTSEILVNQKLSYLHGQNGQFTAEADFPQGDVHLRLTFMPFNSDATVKAEPQRKQPYRFAIGRTTIVGPLVDGPLEYKEVHRRILFNGPSPSDPEEMKDHMKTVIRQFAKKAFRRPIDEPTLDRLVGIGMQNATTPGRRYEQGVGAALQLVLASPRFLFRIEQPIAPTSDQINQHAIRLDDFSLATRLSYFLWGGPPDDELLRLAEEGVLSSQLESQFDRMIAQEWRFRRGLAQFVGQWLQTRDVHNSQADVTKILGVGFDEAGQIFDWQIREGMTQETLRLYEHLLLNNRPAEELLTARYSFLNEPLAKYYGISGVQGQEMRKVELPESSHRRGILTHGSMLVVTSNPTRTSPVKRGLFILENLLGTPAPPAPPNVPALEQSKAGDLANASLRHVLEHHRRDPACAACHARMDPLGLALENFNAIGQWRDKEKTWEWNEKWVSTEQAIDASGKLVSGEAFSRIEELAEILASQRKVDFYRCLTEKIMTFALGRGMTYRDTSAIDSIVAKTIQEGGSLKVLYKSIVTSVPFTHCRNKAYVPTLASQ